MCGRTQILRESKSIPPVSKNNYRTVSGPELVELLRDTTEPVKWIEVSGAVIGHIPAAQAILMVRAGNFTGKCSPKRVLYIREIPAPQPVRDPSYWDGRACGLFRWPNIPVTKRSIVAWGGRISTKVPTTSRLEEVSA